MPKAAPNLKQAYLRNNENNQIELTFQLDVKIDGIGEFHQEIKAVRKNTDTVGSLLQHIINKLHKIIKDKFNLGVEVSSQVNIPILLSYGKKQLKPDRILKALGVPGKVLIFDIFGQRYHVIENAPLVKILKLPIFMFANFSVQPAKFYAVNADRRSCKFRWYKSVDKKKWLKVGEEYNYLVDNEDIDHYLKLVCIPYNDMKSKGPPFEVISDAIVEPIADLPICPFEDRHKFTEERLGLPQFRIMSYNILSERYTDYFDYCPERSLAMDYRKQLLLKEILGYYADIICLQEVDSRHFHNYFKMEFRDKNYHCIYHKKGNRISEGLATIFNKTMFKYHWVEHVVLTELLKRKPFVYILELLEKNNKVKEFFMKQATSLQVTILKIKPIKNSFIIVANTHLFYHPDAGHIRLLQINIITHYISLVKKKIEKEGGKTFVIFCGDYNSRPDTSIYEYMCEGRIDGLHKDCLQISSNGCSLYHRFELSSACGTPTYTNYTPDFKGCLDYIFIEKDKLNVINSVPLPDENVLAKYVGLPNDVFPSDHMALVADLSLS